MDSINSANADLLDRMLTYISNNEDRMYELTTVEFWDGFTFNENESLTAEELVEINKEILDESEDNEFINALNYAVFLNWNHCKKLKNILEFDHMQHIVFSWIVSTPEEIENDVLLSMNEISKRFDEMKAEYDVTKVLPECFQESYLESILAKIKEKCKLEEEIVNEFENFISK